MLPLNYLATARERNEDQNIYSPPHLYYQGSFYWSPHPSHQNVVRVGLCEEQLMYLPTSSQCFLLHQEFRNEGRSSAGTVYVVESI